VQLKVLISTAIACLLLAGCSSPSPLPLPVEESEPAVGKTAPDFSPKKNDDAASENEVVESEFLVDENSPAAQLIRDDQLTLTAEAFGYYQPLLDSSVEVCPDLSEQELADFAMEAKRNLNSVGLRVYNDWFFAVFSDALGPNGYVTWDEDCGFFARSLASIPSDAERLMIRDGLYSPESSYYYQVSLDDAADRCSDLNPSEIADQSLSAVDELQGRGMFRDSRNNLIDGLWLLYQIINEAEANEGQLVECESFALELISSESP
jgi:hypothetical protein